MTPPATTSFAVAIPTRSRPQKLYECLEALAVARRRVPFNVYVCDSSPELAIRDEVRQVCDGFPFVIWSHHSKPGIAAARNACVRAVKERLIVTVDDDIRVEPDAVARLVSRYRSESGPRVVAGTVAVNGAWSSPVKLRAVGWGRYAHPDEDPDFLLTGLLAYPQALGAALPWNERIEVMEDRFAGMLWRSKGISLLFEPGARAVHHHEHRSKEPQHSDVHVYTNLFGTIVASRSPTRALSYDLLGVLAGLRARFRERAAPLPFLRLWLRGHRRFVRDWAYLTELSRTELPPDIW